MSRIVHRTGMALASAALVLAAAVGVSGPVAAPPADVPLAGASGPDAAYKRVSRTFRVGGKAWSTRTRGSRAYAFSTVLDGKPVRFDPCTPIRWTSHTARGPVGGLPVLHSAVARIAAVTGTTWEYVGATSTVPTSAVLPKAPARSYPPVVIGWTDGAASDLLAGQPRSVLGMTRTKWFGVQLADGRRLGATRGAVVALDRTDVLPLRGAASWEAVVLHELGHVLGLAHVADTTELMAASLPRTVSDLQVGDRAGLAKVGRAAGCVTIPG